MRHDDLPAVARWQAAPHAARWFDPARHTPDQLRERYGPRIDGSAPVRMLVVEADGRPVGYVQHYRLADHPAYAAATGRPDAVGIDYAIGVPELVGRGLGPRLITMLVRDEVVPTYPEATVVVASPDPANVRSRRALEKAGFVDVGDVQQPGEPVERLYVLDLGPASQPR